nr:DUF4113 domain-containing protein [Hydrogenophaga sp. 2FB]
MLEYGRALEITVGDTSTYRAFPLIEMQHWPWYLLIDESFIRLDGIRGDLVERAHSMRARILQWVGMPCCIGIASTKSLAKLANHIAKQADRKPGSYPVEHAQVCDLTRLSPSQLDELLAATDVADVWGVGRRISKQLNDQGVHTALDLKRMSPAAARNGWSVVFERTVRELQGESCMDIEDVAPDKKEIACTRSFGAPVRDVVEIQEAVTDFASRASKKLRDQEGVAGQVLVFIRTSPFRKTPQYSRSVTIPMRTPSSDTGAIVAAALMGLTAIFRPGFDYAKAGVMLMDIAPGAREQFELDLGADDPTPAARPRLMEALDRVNDRYGRGTLQLGTGTLGAKPRKWTMKQERRTPAYTTKWEDMPVVRA